MVGSVFHHGVKTPREVREYFGQVLDNRRGPKQCSARLGVLVDGRSYLALIDRFLQMKRQTFGQWKLPSGRPVPFYEAAVRCCMPQLTCRPLNAGEALPLGGGRAFEDPLTAGASTAQLPEACLAAEQLAAEPMKPPACA
mmetsp:Transcript_28857/g.91988  ORF Transcript_28857/g.91988 Transcript_28857/m.91988 type:complete len:140 (+) Transcript_28857:19-438(+)